MYRIVVEKTMEGNLRSVPINGCLFIFNPINGELLIKIINRGEWQGQKRIGQLVKWKAAQIVSAYLRSIEVSSYPNKIISIRKALIDPLEFNLIDFSNVKIYETEIIIAFQSLLKLDLVGGLL